MVLDHNACDLIKPSATVNVVPHLDPDARVIVESPNGPVVQTDEGLRRFPKLVSTTVLLTCSLSGGSCDARSGRNTGDVRFGMARSSPKHDHTPDTILHAVSCCWPMGYSWSSFIARSVLLRCCLNAGFTRKHFFVHRYSATIDDCSPPMTLRISFLIAV